MNFPPEDLPPREQLQFLRKANPACSDLLCGLIALRARNRDTALAYFRKDNSPLAKLLLAELGN